MSGQATAGHALPLLPKHSPAILLAHFVGDVGRGGVISSAFAQRGKAAGNGPNARPSPMSFSFLDANACSSAVPTKQLALPHGIHDAATMTSLFFEDHCFLRGTSRSEPFTSSADRGFLLGGLAALILQFAFIEAHRWIRPPDSGLVK